MLMILKYHFKINLGPGPAKVPGFFISSKKVKLQIQFLGK